MKLKFINCLLAVALLGGSAQLLTSCKDTNEDEWAQVQGQIKTLQAKHDQDIATLNGLISALQGQVDALKVELDGYVKKVDFNNYVDAYIQKVSDYNNLKEVLDALKAVSNEVNDAHGKYNTIGERFAALELALAEAQAQIGDLNTFMNDWNSALTAANTNIQEVVNTVALAKSNEARIKALEDAIAKLQSCDCAEKIAAIEEQLKTFATKEELNNAVNKIWTDLNDKISAATEGDIKTIEDLAASVKDLSVDLSELKSMVTLLQKRISSIELQGTWNSVFGEFNLPVGVQSNMLVGLAGHQNYPHAKFPSTSQVNTYNQMVPCITESDIRMMTMCGLEVQDLPQGKILARKLGDKVNLGTIYFTVNPGNIDLADKTFTLENSRGEVSLATLSNIRPSDKLINLGYARSEANGLYEADVLVAEGDIEKVRFAIDEGFKDDVLNLIEGAKANGNTIIGLASLFYNQINGILPALAVSGTWTEDAATLKVTSQYGVGAVVYQPLSFRMLKDLSLPTIPAIPDLSKYEFDLGANNVQLAFDEMFTVSSANLTISSKLHIIVDVHAENLDITVENYPVIDNDGNQTGTTTLQYTTASINTVVDDLVAAMRAQIPADATAAIKADLNAGIDNFAITAQAKVDENANSIRIAQDFNDTLQDIQDNINGKISKLSDRLSALTSRAQSLINRLNRVLKNPNHYLQPALMYHTSNYYGIMSNSKAFPSQFVLDGGNSVTLVPTTYTLEAVAPAYEKLVAVTNVWLTADARHTAKGLSEEWQPDPKCVELLKAANAQEYMNEIVSGERRTIPFLFEGASGYTYEILYTAIDFQGCASSQKFYVTVK